jgi:hypothetical protein
VPLPSKTTWSTKLLLHGGEHRGSQLLGGDAGVEDGEEIDDLAGGRRSSERACRSGAREPCGAIARGLGRQARGRPHDGGREDRGDREVAVELRS